MSDIIKDVRVSALAILRSQSQHSPECIAQTCAPLISPNDNTGLPPRNAVLWCKVGGMIRDFDRMPQDKTSREFKILMQYISEVDSGRLRYLREASERTKIFIGGEINPGMRQEQSELNAELDKLKKIHDTLPDQEREKFDKALAERLSAVWKIAQGKDKNDSDVKTRTLVLRDLLLLCKLFELPDPTQ